MPPASFQYDCSMWIVSLNLHGVHQMLEALFIACRCVSADLLVLSRWQRAIPVVSPNLHGLHQAFVALFIHSLELIIYGSEHI